jgi:hypothetical protein
MIATMTIEAATDREIFLAYLDECLCSKLQSGDVVVMDNLSSHIARSRLIRRCTFPASARRTCEFRLDSRLFLSYALVNIPLVYSRVEQSERQTGTPMDCNVRV